MGGKSMGIGMGSAAALGGVAATLMGAPEIGIPMIMGGIGSATGGGLGGGRGALAGGLTGAQAGLGMDASGASSWIGSKVPDFSGNLKGLFGSGQPTLDPSTFMAMANQNPGMADAASTEGLTPDLSNTEQGLSKDAQGLVSGLMGLPLPLLSMLFKQGQGGSQMDIPLPLISMLFRQNGQGQSGAPPPVPQGPAAQTPPAPVPQGNLPNSMSGIASPAEQLQKYRQMLLSQGTGLA
jgi:hypothetical protein